MRLLPADHRCLSWAPADQHHRPVCTSSCRPAAGSCGDDRRTYCHSDGRFYSQRERSSDQDFRQKAVAVIDFAILLAKVEGIVQWSAHPWCTHRSNDIDHAERRWQKGPVKPFPWLSMPPLPECRMFRLLCLPRPQIIHRRFRAIRGPDRRTSLSKFLSATGCGSCLL